MVTYTLNIYNKTDTSSWSVCLWKEFPNLVSSFPVAWKSKALNRAGSEASCNTITWETTPNVSLVNSHDAHQRGKWTSSQLWDTKSGDVWTVIDDKDSGVQTFEHPPGSCSSGVQIINHSSAELNLGIGMDRNLMCVVPGLLGGTTTDVEFNPTYYMKLVETVIVSQEISAATQTDAIKVEFPPKVYSMDYIMDIEGNQLTLEPLEPRKKATAHINIKADNVAKATILMQLLKSSDVKTGLNSLGCHVLSISKNQDSGHITLDVIAQQDAHEDTQSNKHGDFVKNYLLQRVDEKNKFTVSFSPTVLPLIFTIAAAGLVAINIWNMFQHKAVYTFSYDKGKVDIVPIFPKTSTEAKEQVKLVPQSFSPKSKDDFEELLQAFTNWASKNLTTDEYGKPVMPVVKRV